MKGLEKLLDAILDFLEENPGDIVEGFDIIVAKMIKEGKLPHSSKER